MARGVMLLSLVLFSSILTTVRAHPLCWYGPDGSPSHTYQPTFCTNDINGNCCSGNQEKDVQSRYKKVNPTGDCAALHKEVVCGVCLGFSAHLYERLGPDPRYGVEDGMTLTKEFCHSYVEACGAQLNLPTDYCSVHSGGGDTDMFWSYPLKVDNTDFTGGLQKAFKSLPSDQLPKGPMAMHMSPDSSMWWVAGQYGQIVEIDAFDPTVYWATEVLDISSGYDLYIGFEEGLLDFAFHPEFTTNGLFYVHYSAVTASGEKSRTRISRFTYNKGNSGKTSRSMVILSTSTPIQTSIHVGGWIGFKPSDYKGAKKDWYELYWSVGDGGPQQDTTFEAQNTYTQHGAMMRILVSSDPGVINYAIPNSNPFASKGGLPEICAYGMRNPFKCSFDRDNDDLYCGEVGQNRLEEVNIIKCGNNYGWNSFEAGRCNDAIEGGNCWNIDRSPYTLPTFQYCHPDYYSDSSEDQYTGGNDICGDRTVVGASVIGGYVYRGSKYEDIGLIGRYIFHDFEYKSMHYLKPDGNGWKAGTMFPKNSLDKIVSFAEDNSGELYIINWGGDIYELPCGDLCPDVEVTYPDYTSKGCFVDYSSPVMNADYFSSGTMTTDECALFCYGLGHPFFGTQYGNECYCGDQNTNLHETSTQCNMDCAGDDSKKCGGYNALSAYTLDALFENPEETCTVLGGECLEKKECCKGTGSYNKKTKCKKNKCCMKKKKYCEIDEDCCGKLTCVSSSCTKVNNKSIY